MLCNKKMITCPCLKYFKNFYLSQLQLLNHLISIKSSRFTLVEKQRIKNKFLKGDHRKHFVQFIKQIKFLRFLFNKGNENEQLAHLFVILS